MSDDVSADDIAELEAIPVIRGDEIWEAFAVVWVDSERTAVLDLTGKEVAAEIRWKGGEQAVTVEVADPPTLGMANLSLTAEQTAAMPLGQLGTLYIEIDGVTWGAGPVNVEEGYFNAG